MDKKANSKFTSPTTNLNGEIISIACQINKNRDVNLNYKIKTLLQRKTLHSFRLLICR